MGQNDLAIHTGQILTLYPSLQTIEYFNTFKVHDMRNLKYLCNIWTLNYMYSEYILLFSKHPPPLDTYIIGVNKSNFENSLKAET